MLSRLSAIPKTPVRQCVGAYTRLYSTTNDTNPSKTKETSPFEKVTVFGAGLMGAGIAQVSAMSNHQVQLVDVSEDAINKGQTYILKSLKRIAKKKFPESQPEQISFTENIYSKIDFSTNPELAVSNADLVVEAIIENIDIKRKIFTQLDAVAPKHTIFTSNTSSLPIADIFSVVSETRKATTAGLHFFNPVSQMKLVEIVKSNTTNTDTFDKLTSFCLALGKAPVTCKDTPGFIVNRLLVPYMMEAIRMLERGDASAKDIDTAMKLGAGYPMGPFELLDYVGLDTVKFITNGWYESYPELRASGIASPSKMLDDLVSSGKLGVKSGEGFYSYAKKA
ncbi:Hydroxyacyl-coenzyme A dehydrogenase, mitochondrial [Smittium culicis]|uniref:3-hydroxyacyl-CoA dehydrogenase n=1 Tax=Smittium culicis TaxID=133412 RepID=A0A1R1YDW3_9FUNG|nr:Hydroxyacyl-coenzyme A dehydrogenase, mitochondrial [Smittium culicis]